MASYPALSLAVEAAEVAEPHPADGQYGFTVTAADLEPPVPTLENKHKVPVNIPRNRKY